MSLAIPAIWTFNYVNKRSHPNQESIFNKRNVHQKSRNKKTISRQKQSTNFNLSFTLGNVEQHDFEVFINYCINFWTKNINTKGIDKPISKDSFITKLVTLITTNMLIPESNQEQTSEDTSKLISQSLSHIKNDHIDFDQFCQFMAKFGPETQIIKKISSLINFSKQTGDWLKLNDNPNSTNSFYGSFDKSQANCFILHTNPPIKAWILKVKIMAM